MEKPALPTLPPFQKAGPFWGCKFIAEAEGWRLLQAVFEPQPHTQHPPTGQREEQAGLWRESKRPFCGEKGGGKRLSNCSDSQLTPPGPRRQALLLSYGDA